MPDKIQLDIKGSPKPLIISVPCQYRAELLEPYLSKALNKCNETFKQISLNNKYENTFIFNRSKLLEDCAAALIAILDTYFQLKIHKSLTNIVKDAVRFRKEKDKYQKNHPNLSEKLI